MLRQICVDACCGLIDRLLHTGYPSIEDVARLLGCSPRTLQRLLNEQGVSYSDLVEHHRCQSACDALEHTKRPIQEIAATLGYADASGFARAFRRWTGTAPRVYRNRLRSR